MQKRSHDPHASTSSRHGESTREPSGSASEFDLSSIYQISLAADALAAVEDLGGLAESSTAPVQSVEEILAQAEETLKNHSPHLFDSVGLEEEEPPVRDSDSPCLI